jgi:signal transduction histidine kinase/CheY-like chemotaxis protein
MDKSTGKFDLIRPDESQQYMLEGIIRDIAISKDSIIWLATIYGLTQYDITKESFRIYTEQDGMAENILTAVVIDHNNDIWVSGNQYISKLDRTSGRFYNYDATGYVNNFISRSKFIDDENRIYFGALNGVYSFQADEIQSNFKKPHIVLTGVKVRNEKYISDVAPEDMTKLVLNSQQKDVAFQFTGIQLNQPESVIYRCKLEGYDEDWQYLESLNIANYTNLNPGGYRLIAQATMLNSDWGTDELSLDVIITPAFTQTNWFRALIALIIGLIAYFSYRIWTYNLQLKREKSFAVKASNYRMQFLSHASHEIRTPMNAIVGLSGLVAKTELNTRQSKYVAAIEQASKNLLQIINELLDHSKIESGKFSFTHSLFDLDLVIEQLEAMFLPLAKEKNLQLHFYVDDILAKHYWGDPLRLTQILTNLVGNSLKFTEKGEVSLHVTSGEKTDKVTDLKFEVRDTGIGIPENQLDRVFDRFGVDQISHESGGTGLGLYITRELIKGQNGDIHISSRVGEGTIVKFKIPFETGKNIPEKKYLPVDKVCTDYLNVLVVDDAPFNHLVVNGILENKFPNARILSAENGPEALRLFEENNLDIIILDARMPGMDGLEVCRRIRSNTENKNDIIVLGATAGAMPEQIQACLESGMNDVITKPIHPDQLYQKIIQLLQLSQ